MTLEGAFQNIKCAVGRIEREGRWYVVPEPAGAARTRTSKLGSSEIVEGASQTWMRGRSSDWVWVSAADKWAAMPGIITRTGWTWWERTRCADGARVHRHHAREPARVHWHDHSDIPVCMEWYLHGARIASLRPDTVDGDPVWRYELHVEDGVRGGTLPRN